MSLGNVNFVSDNEADAEDAQPDLQGQTDNSYEKQLKEPIPRCSTNRLFVVYIRL